MTGSPNDVWPPLIVATDKPRWLWWRDSALTVAMWALFAAMLESEFGLFFGRYLDEHWGFHIHTKPHWHRFFGLLEGYVWLIIMLLGFLAAATVATIHRTRNLLRHAQPPSLPTDEEARHARTDAATLEAARKLRKVTVHVDAGGAPRFEMRE